MISNNEDNKAWQRTVSKNQELLNISKVTQIAQEVLIIEPKYFIYMTSFSSLNLSLIM